MAAPKVKKIHTGYVPRDWQSKAHIQARRHNVLVFHRRGGKTVWTINHLINKAIKFDAMCPLTGEPLINPQFGYVATTRAQVENIAWQYLKDYLRHIPGVKFNEQKLRASFPHPRGICKIYLFGAENFDAMRGLYFDGYALDEYADMHPDVRDKVLLPTISDRKGWEVIIGTPKGENAFKDIYDYALSNPDDWYTTLESAETTGIIGPDELKMLRATMSDEAFRQEFLCDFNAAPSGKYYQRYIDEARREGRITGVPYDSHVPVVTYWDLGFNDSTSIWFVQEVGREIHVIDYLEEHGKGLEWYVEQIDAKPYRYSAHKLPHDAEHHELSTGRTRTEFLRECGLDDIEIMPRSKNVAEDIHAVRQILPKCWFDRVKCEQGIKALAAYERKFDAKLKVYSDKPLHNWASHAADGFRYFAMDYKPGFGSGRLNSINNLPRTADSTYDILDW